MAEPHDISEKVQSKAAEFVDLFMASDPDCSVAVKADALAAIAMIMTANLIMNWGILPSTSDKS